MRMWCWVVCGGLGCLLLVQPAGAGLPARNRPVALVYALEGEAAQAEPSRVLRPIRLYDRLAKGAVVTTGADGRLSLAFVNGRRYELGPDSRATFSAADLAQRSGSIDVKQPRRGVRDPDAGLAGPARSGETEKLVILGSDVADLITTIDHNLQHADTDPRFQRKVMYTEFPASQLPAFRKLSAVQAQALLEKFDRWLAEHVDNDRPDDDSLPAMRVGMGIYYFEEPMVPISRKGQ